MWNWLPAGLPSLNNRWLLVYRSFWIAALALALPSVLYFIPRESFESTRNYRLFYEAGLVTAPTNAQGQLVHAFGPASRAAGIGRDELLLAIDGTPLPTDLKDGAALLDKPEGSPVRLTLKSADGRVHEATTRIDRRGFDETYRRVGLTFEGRRFAALAINTIASLLGLLFATLLFLRRPRDPVAALLAMGVTTSLISLSAMFAAVPHWIGSGLQVFVNAAIIIGLAAFPDGRFTPRWASLSILPVIGLAIALEAAYRGASIDVLGNLLVLGIVGTIVAAAIVRYRRTPVGIARQQIKFATLGIAAMALGSALEAAFRIAQLGVTDEGVRAWLILGNNFGSIGIAGFYIGMLVSLLRHRLYDAEIAISRSAVVATLTLMLGATFAATEKIVEAMGKQYFGEQGGATSAGIAAAIAALLIAPLHGRVSRWAERRFQKGLLKLRDGLPLLVGDLRETAGPERIADIALDRIAAGTRATRGAVVLGDRLVGIRDVSRDDFDGWRAARPLTQDTPAFDSNDPLLPVRIALGADGCGRVGWLLLGPRPDGTLFGKDEREVLADLADPLARALNIAATREAETNERREEVRTLRQLVAALEQRLNRLDPKMA